jgi:translation initiation factor 1
MGKKDRSKQKVSLDADTTGFGHNPFAALLNREQADHEASAEGATPPKSAPPLVETATESDKRGLGNLKKVILRLERKGRGGKTVTLVEGIESLGAEMIEAEARRVRKALGCGAVVEEGKIVVQGDQRERLAGWLTQQGIPKIVT